MNPACRSCGGRLDTTVADLGMTPLANSYVDPRDAHKPDELYPLHARACSDCFLVQVDDVVPPEHIFSDYAYFSSVSDSWVAHCRRFSEEATNRLGLDRQSFVVEVASNDGYLLHNFVQASIPALGVEPAANVAAVALSRDVPTKVAFFGIQTADAIRREHGMADLIVANNVMAHVPDLPDFVAGLSRLLSADGTVTIEVPHLLRLISGMQFDTIYHEHYSYFSLLAMQAALGLYGLSIYDVDELSTHGGSLRYWVCHQGRYPTMARVEEVLARERQAGLDDLSVLASFDDAIKAVISGLRSYLSSVKAAGQRVVGYGAAAKGNTLLNVANVNGELIDFVVDRSEHKQGKLLPGTRLLVAPPEVLDADPPDVILLLAWNLADEIISQLAHLRGQGVRFVVPIPAVEEIS